MGEKEARGGIWVKEKETLKGCWLAKLVPPTLRGKRDLHLKPYRHPSPACLRAGGGELGREFGPTLGFLKMLVFGPGNVPTGRNVLRKLAQIGPPAGNLARKMLII